LELRLKKKGKSIGMQLEGLGTGILSLQFGWNICRLKYIFLKSKQSFLNMSSPGSTKIATHHSWQCNHSKMWLQDLDFIALTDLVPRFPLWLGFLPVVTWAGELDVQLVSSFQANLD
jgi:hypothetical protein